MRIGKWLDIEETDNPGRKTKRWDVNHTDETWLGEIEWHCPWRQYVFMPADGTIYSRSCLRDIGDFIDKEMRARKGGS